MRGKKQRRLGSNSPFYTPVKERWKLHKAKYMLQAEWSWKWCFFVGGGVIFLLRRLHQSKKMKCKKKKRKSGLVSICYSAETSLAILLFLCSLFWGHSWTALVSAGQWHEWATGDHGRSDDAGLFSSATRTVPSDGSPPTWVPRGYLPWFPRRAVPFSRYHLRAAATRVSFLSQVGAVPNIPQLNGGKMPCKLKNKVTRIKLGSSPCMMNVFSNCVHHHLCHQARFAFFMHLQIGNQRYSMMWCSSMHALKLHKEAKACFFQLSHVSSTLRKTNVCKKLTEQLQTMRKPMQFLVFIITGCNLLFGTAACGWFFVKWKQ